MQKDSEQSESAEAVSSTRLLGEFERKKWLMQWVAKNRHADVLDSDLVDAYIAATNAKHRPTCWGAYKCPMLGRDLAALAKCIALKRWRNGLRGTWQPGFPRWVWSYELGHATYLYSPTTSRITRRKGQ